MFIFALRQSEPPHKMNPILYNLPVVQFAPRISEQRDAVSCHYSFSIVVVVVAAAAAVVVVVVEDVTNIR
jgi:hypothetical protein